VQNQRLRLFDHSVVSQRKTVISRRDQQGAPQILRGDLILSGNPMKLDYVKNKDLTLFVVLAICCAFTTNLIMGGNSSRYAFCFSSEKCFSEPIQ